MLNSFQHPCAASARTGAALGSWDRVWTLKQVQGDDPAGSESC